MKKTLVLALAVLATLLLTGASGSKPLDVGIVLDLLDAGVSENSIRRYVERNDFAFEITAEDLKALKKAGASEDLVAFLQEREADGYGEGEGGDAEDGEADYGVAYSSPGYAYGFATAYPYYYPLYDYPTYYYDPYFYAPYPYFHFSYTYPYHHSRRYSGSRLGGRSGRGTGVYSYWYRNRAGSGGTRSSSTGSRSSAPRTQSHGRSGGRGRH